MHRPSEEQSVGRAAECARKTRPGAAVVYDTCSAERASWGHGHHLSARVHRRSERVLTGGTSQGLLRALVEAFQGFSCRLEAGQAPGCPRFRLACRTDSLPWCNASGFRLEERSRRQGILSAGHVEADTHHPPRGTPKTLTVRRRGPSPGLLRSPGHNDFDVSGAGLARGGSGVTPSR